MKIQLDSSLRGEILDIGGGGEGVIGRIYRQRAIAIDNCPEELDEAPDVCKKMLMDATSLRFDDSRFDHVTAFYSMMYMTRDEQQMAIKEAHRVLRPGGALHIWDAVIPSAYPDPFVIDLEIDANGTALNTTYGVVKMDSQDMELFIRICQENNMSLVEKATYSGQFYLQFRKAVR